MTTSIILSNYNYGSFLGESVASALSQDAADVEVIIVDDGSTDGSREIATAFEASARVLLQPNGGHASAMNAGYRASSGDLVIFLDADDRLRSSCVSTVQRHWDHKFSKLHFGLSVIDATGQPCGYSYSRDNLPSGDLRASVAMTGLVASAPSSGNVFARWFLDEVMPIPETDWRAGPDVYLFNLAALYGEIGSIADLLGEYRIHSSNTSNPIRNNRLRLSVLSQNIAREVTTDEALARHAPRAGVPYQRGTLTGSLPHIQQRLVEDKMLASNAGFDALLFYFRKIIQSNLSPLKKAANLCWSLALWILPRRLAESVIVFGYRRGIVFATNKHIVR
jgi:glycosyltransferase involved in cell wall biosynthesis